MRLLTINTHSLEEPDYERKTAKFCKILEQERPDIVALQEVNQRMDGEVLSADSLPGFFPCPDSPRPVREGNHCARLARDLSDCALTYYWTWVSAKIGYGKYDEGLALLSRSPIRQVRQYLISRADDYGNWKTRRVLGIETEAFPGQWFFSIHMGWWEDEEEPFAAQWERLNISLCRDGLIEDGVWLMGDFNSPAQVRGQGYDLITESGWKDTYEMAREKDCGDTVEKQIDGWRERGAFSSGMRLDYIFSSRDAKVKQSYVICNGKNGPVVSDHYGIIIEVES